MVSGAFAAVFGADCCKRRPTQVDCGRLLGLYIAVRLCWTTITNKIHGKVAAQVVYVWKHVQHQFLVLLRPFLESTAVYCGNYRSTPVSGAFLTQYSPKTAAKAPKTDVGRVSGETKNDTESFS